MKKTWLWIVCFLWATTTMKGQIDAPKDSVQLAEVVVQGAKVISRTDGKLIFPSEEMIRSASSGYSLLKMLSLPQVKVDDINESISPTNSLIGSVQVRINDVEASVADLQSLQPNEVEKVECIDRPGVRYGEDVGMVINIITRPIEKGYVVGVGGTWLSKSDYTKGTAYSKWNSGRNELSLNYSGDYRHSTGMNSLETADYLMADDTYQRVERRTTDAFSRNHSHNLQARYSLIDSDRLAFLATLSTSVTNNTRNYEQTEVNTSDQLETTDIREKNVSPLLDLYGKLALGKGQTLIANLTGSYTHTDYDYLFTSDPTTFGYSTLGKSKVLQSEVLYENRLKPFTWTGGVRYNQKFIRNRYTGDADLLSRIHTSNLYVFSQLQGKMGLLGYMVGVGLSREYYRQGTSGYDRLWLRPKLNLSFPLTSVVKLNYTLSSYPATSKLQNMSEMTIITTGLEYTQGNPNLIMDRRDEQTLTLSYQSPRLYTEWMTFFRHCAHPAMQHIERTDDNHFVTSFREGRRINFLLSQSYTSFDIIPQHLKTDFTAQVVHCVNDGQDYSHRLTAFNYNLGLTAWMGAWTVMAGMDNGFHFMENEYEGRNVFSNFLQVSYQWKGLSASLLWQNLFKQNGKVVEVIYHNRLVSKQLLVRNRDTSNLIGFKLVWTFSKGRKFTGIDRDTDSLKDTETGIAKSGK